MDEIALLDHSHLQPHSFQYLDKPRNSEPSNCPVSSMACHLTIKSTNTMEDITSPAKYTGKICASCSLPESVGEQIPTRRNAQFTMLQHPFRIAITDQSMNLSTGWGSKPPQLLWYTTWFRSQQLPMLQEFCSSKNWHQGQQTGTLWLHAIR